MYLTFYSSAFGGICLFLALLLQKRSLRKAAERVRKELEEVDPDMDPQLRNSYVEDDINITPADSAPDSN